MAVFCVIRIIATIGRRTDMSDGKKFLGNWYADALMRSSNRVIHRPIGDIPGCVPAPRSGTFVAISAEQAQAECAKRAQEYVDTVDNFLNSRGASFPDVLASLGKPMQGAYGESL